MAVYRPNPSLLEVQLRSIQDQTCADWICHIGIDGTDNLTAALLRELIGDDTRFVIHEYSDNVGFYLNFERLLNEVDSATSWIALSDQDDYWYTEKLAVLVAALDANDVQAVCGQARIAKPDGSSSGVSVRREVRLESLILNNQATGSLMVFRGELLNDVLPFPEPTSTAFHDHWIGVCALARGRLPQLPQVVQDYVQHDHNVIGEAQAESIGTRVQRAAQAGGGLSRMIGYIRDERWGWRVRMSQRLLRLDPRSAQSFVRATAERGLNATILFHLVGAAIRRELPASRAISLMTGAASWRIHKFKTDRLSSRSKPAERNDTKRGTA